MRACLGLQGPRLRDEVPGAKYNTLGRAPFSGPLVPTSCKAAKPEL